MSVLLVSPRGIEEGGAGSAPPEDGFLWFDYVRSSEPDWAVEVAAVGGLEVEPDHVSDSLTADHPSFHDGTDAYDMLVVRALTQGIDPFDYDTRSIACFVTESLVVTVRSAADHQVEALLARLRRPAVRRPRRPLGLLHRILAGVMDSYLALREPLLAQLTEWQRELLDPDHPFEDWQTLMGRRARLRRLEADCEQIEDLLESFRDDPAVEIDDRMQVRFSDLLEHLRRALGHVRHTRGEIDSLVQLHFAAMAHRTNQVMKVLTIVAAIFLPLSLIAGIFGMNFAHMPELRQPWGYYGALGLMAAVAVAMLIVFKRKRWI